MEGVTHPVANRWTWHFEGTITSADDYYTIVEPKTSQDFSYGVGELETIDEAFGTATGGGGNTLVDAGQTWTADTYNGDILAITSGTGAGQVREIIDTQTSTLVIGNPNGPGWSNNGGTAPASGSGYAIYKLSKWLPILTAYQITIATNGSNGYVQIVSSAVTSRKKVLHSTGGPTNPTGVWSESGLSSIGVEGCGILIFTTEASITFSASAEGYFAYDGYGAVAVPS